MTVVLIVVAIWIAFNIAFVAVLALRERLRNRDRRRHIEACERLEVVRMRMRQDTMDRQLAEIRNLPTLNHD